MTTDKAEHVGSIAHSPLLFSLAAQAHERSLKAHKEGKAYQGDAIAAVILAVASLEGFINDLVSLHSILGRPLSLAIISEHWEVFEGLSIQAKYLLLGSLLKRPFQKGAQPYQDFQLLIQLRNLLVHLKPGEVLREGDRLQWREPGILKKLVARKLISDAVLNITHHQTTSWYVEMSNVKVAAWACNTTVAVVSHVRDGLPQSALSAATDTILRRFNEVPSS